MKFLTLILTSILSLSSLTSPKSAIEFWNSYDPEKEPLQVKLIKEWQEQGITYQALTYHLATLKGSNLSASPRIAAVYAFPSHKKDLPAILHSHGGGQKANVVYAGYWASLGYACISVNWGEKQFLEEAHDNTDWDGIAAGFLGDKDSKHHNPVTPGKNTLFKEPHILNSSWTLYSMACRRAITFLTQQDNVNAEKIGMTGHSMGGRVTVSTATDPRLKAVSPSVGGTGFLYKDIWGIPDSKRKLMENQDLYENTISAQSSWPHIKAPVQFLGATNDFNSPTEFIFKGMSLLPKSTQSSVALAPHLNHRFTQGAFTARVMWFESHLKENFTYPKTAKTQLILNDQSGIPIFKVWPEQTAGLEIDKVDIYYGYARDPRVRYWANARAIQTGDHWQAHCPLFDTDEPLFIYANITYKMPQTINMPRGFYASKVISVASQYHSIYPDQLKKNNVQETAKVHRLIDDFKHGMHDWYTLSANNPQHWFYSTRKVVDYRWVGPKNGQLEFELSVENSGNELGVVAEVNTWRGYTGAQRDIYIAKALPKQGISKIVLSLEDFKNKKGESLKDWDELTELAFTPYNKAAQNKNKPWSGKPLKLLNLQWKDGVYVKRPKPYLKKSDKQAHYSSKSFSDEFQQAIKNSIKLEEQDEKQ